MIDLRTIAPFDQATILDSVAKTRRAVVVHAREQARHQVERPLRGRQADALEATTALAHQGVQSFEAQRQVAAPLVAGQRVDLVDDDGPHPAQHGP